MSGRLRVLTGALSVALLVLALMAVYVGKRGYATELWDRLGERGAPAQVVDLHDIGQLQAAFNRASGTPRLVVLFSPT